VCIVHFAGPASLVHSESCPDTHICTHEQYHCADHLGNVQSVRKAQLPVLALIWAAPGYTGWAVRRRVGGWGTGCDAGLKAD
jgi:hypothetical protein